MPSQGLALLVYLELVKRGRSTRSANKQPLQFMSAAPETEPESTYNVLVPKGNHWS